MGSHRTPAWAPAAICANWGRPTASATMPMATRAFTVTFIRKDTRLPVNTCSIIVYLSFTVNHNSPV